MGQQTLVQLAGKHRDAVHPGVVPEEVAGEANRVAAAGHQHLLIEVRPFLYWLFSSRLRPGARSGSHWESGST